MEQTPTSSRRMLAVGIVAIMALIVVIAIVSTLLFGTTRQETNNAATESTDSIATKEAVKENLNDLDATIKQAAKDQAATKAAQKDGDSQIKVGL